MIKMTHLKGRTGPCKLFVLAFLLSACASEPTPPPVDVIGTTAAQMASVMLTQTVAAYSPTPPPPTATTIPTETPIPEPTKDASINTIVVHTPTTCKRGPGENAVLISNLPVPKVLELLGIGSVPGYYVVKNPYFNSPCWVPAADVTVDPAMDLSQFPTMTP
jgi:hypothetical protein